VRTVHEALAVAPPLTGAAYGALIERLDPVWTDEVVCPVHLAVRALRTAQEAAAVGDVGEATAAHRTARDRLFDALWHAGLLTLDEQLEQIAAADATGAGPPGHGGVRVRAGNPLQMRQWNAWRPDQR
jgi:hypothetical protein